MATIHVGGVPEHFNYPWQLAIENGFFKNEGLDVQWHNYAGGTGQQIKGLVNGDIQMATILTEGLIKEICHGTPLKIVQNYVHTPLTWGIHTGVNSPLKHHRDIYKHKYAISRMGSGSHLMAIVDALTRHYILKPEQFVVVNDLDGAVKSLTAGETDVFYWEKFTTKHLVDNGTLRRIGVYITSWPSFMIASNDTFIKEAHEDIQKVLKVINYTCRHLMKSQEAINMFIDRYHMLPDDANEWFHNTAWQTNNYLHEKMLYNVMYTLRTSGLIQYGVQAEQLVSDFVQLV